MGSLWIKVLVIGIFTLSWTKGQFSFERCSPVNHLAAFPGNCFKFLACSSYGYIPMDCPANLAFDERTQVCDYRIFVPGCENVKYLGPCEPTPCIRGECVSSATIASGYKCICESGFTGFDCSVDINECASVPCVHGTCQNTFGSFKCDCGNSGYTGTFCEIGPDMECISGQACAHGTCQNGPVNSMCLCDTGYEGELCDQLVQDPSCTPSPCMNGGQCVSSGSSGTTCDCSNTGFSGSRCEVAIDDCSPNPCQNGGVCADGVNTYTCDCSDGFTGVNCEEQGSQTNFCTNPFPCNNGTCTSFSSGFRCNCTGTNMEGIFCDIPLINPCSTNPCVRGSCQQAGDSFICDCAGTGFTGPTCNEPSEPIGPDDCIRSQCVHGVCVDGDNTYTCDCTGTVYIGPFCELTECDVQGFNPCMNGGTCNPAVAADYTCSCATGFTGGNCETLIMPTGCSQPQCPSDVPRYNYPTWNDTSCSTYYNCEFGVLEVRNCPAGQKFDVITMVCKDATDILGVFCEAFRL